MPSGNNAPDRDAPNSTAPRRTAPRGGASGNTVDVVVAFVVAFLLYGLLLLIAWHYRNGEHFLPFLTWGVLGTGLGWIVGIAASPYDDAERAGFGSAGKVVSSFLGGYVLSKVDPALTERAKGLTEVGLSDPPTILAAITLTAFLVTVSVTYVSRSYWHRERPSRT